MTTASAPLAIPACDREAFRRDFNQRPVLFSHSLADHPLFDLERLTRLSRVLPKGDVYVSSGQNEAGTQFKSAGIANLKAEDAISHIESNGIRILLKRVEQDPDYRSLLNSCLDSFLPYFESGFRESIKSLESFIFITAPRCVTPYHMDPEIGFFFQIRGDKHYHLFDRSIIATEEAERYYRRLSGDFDAIRFSEGQEESAQVLDFKPGMGFIQPLNAPHWVGTRDQTAVSYTFTIETRETRARAASLMINGHLRRLGLKPVPPGTSKIADSAKLSAMEGMQGLRRMKRALVRRWRLS